MKKRLAVFISGQGSNLSVFLQNKENFESILVVSNKKEANGLNKARRFGVESLVLLSPINWSELSNDLKSRNIDYIFLAGFMKIVPASFVDNWKDSVFNIHPSFLPKYKGLKSIQRAFENKEAVGVSIHKVTPDVDSGEILFQEEAVGEKRVRELSFDDVEFYTHVCEQKLVRNWIGKWA